MLASVVAHQKRRYENVSLTSSTSSSPSTMKRRRSGNWDLIYGFAFLVVFILVHTIFISHETRSYKQEAGGGNLSLTDFSLQRARKLKQIRKNLVDTVEKMKEPHPQNRKEAAALALNSVYRKNLKSRNYLIKQQSGVDALQRHSFFVDACVTQNLTQLEVSDCVNDNEMAARRSHVTRQCDAMKDNATAAQKLNPFIDSQKIFVLKYRKLTWCPVYKAASSNWFQLLPILSNFRPSQIKILKRRFLQANELAPIVARPLPLNQFRKYVSTNDPIKFLVVRHPFDRLLSAYRDKLERMNEHYYTKYGSAIVGKYRQQSVDRFGENDADDDKNVTNGCPAGVAHCGRDDSATPTFWEFVRALLDGFIDVDDHWSPVYISCSLCRVSYDVILHFEYLSDEQGYFLRQLGLENLLGIEKLQRNKNPNRLSPAERRAYFRTLDGSELNALYQFYKVDFDLFQYDLKSYLDDDGGGAR